MNYVRSLFVVLPRLKLFWLAVIGLALVAVVLLGRALSIDSHRQGSFLWQFLIYLGGALLGFACNAFFTCKDQFLLRACRDAVYFVSNTIPKPRVHELGDRVSLNALGGKWHEITHVSERMLQHLYSVFGAEKLSLREASVYEARGELSEFAIVLNTRYGIPHLETRRRIWGKKAKVTIEVADLDRYQPGHDLVSSQYWPEMDRSANQLLGTAQSSDEAVMVTNVVATITALEASGCGESLLVRQSGGSFSGQ